VDARIINRRDLDFVLYELLEVEGLASRARYSEHSREVFDAVIDTACRIAAEQFASHGAKGDENEPRFENGRAGEPRLRVSFGSSLAVTTGHATVKAPGPPGSIEKGAEERRGYVLTATSPAAGTVRFEVTLELLGSSAARQR